MIQSETYEKRMGKEGIVGKKESLTVVYLQKCFREPSGEFSTERGDGGNDQNPVSLSHSIIGLLWQRESPRDHQLTTLWQLLLSHREFLQNTVLAAIGTTGMTHLFSFYYGSF